jgi:hypothetical protein
VLETIGVGRTLEDVAGELSVSRQAVHLARTRALQRLRRALGGDPAP